MLPELNDYFLEYQAEGVGELLYGLIFQVAQETAHRYPPDIYAPNRVWDEDAISSLVQDFSISWLLENGRLEYYLLSCGSSSGLKSAIRSELKRYLTNQKRRSEYTNLFGRVKLVLLEDDFQLVAGRLEQINSTIWGLKEWGEKPTVQQREAMIEAMFTVTLPPLIKYRADSKKLSPVITTSDLRRLLREALVYLDSYIGFSLLMQSLRYRLNMFDIDEISFEQTITSDSEQTYADIIPATRSLEEVVSSALIAEDLFDRLTDRQRKVVALYMSLQNPTVERIAEQSGVSKSTVHNELKHITDIIEALELTPDETAGTLSSLGDVCAKYINQEGLGLGNWSQDAEGKDENG